MSDINECTVCRLVLGKREPAFRRITAEGHPDPIWFCLNCDVRGMKMAQRLAANCQKLFGDDFGWGNFTKEWEQDLDPMKDNSQRPDDGS